MKGIKAVGFGTYVRKSWQSSVAYAIGLLELTFRARQMQEDSEQGIETYIAVTLLYFLCAFIANRVMALIEARTRIPGSIG